MKKVLIVFTDIHIAYSPTTLNLFNILQERGFDATLLAARPEKWFSDKKIEKRGVKYVDFPVAFMHHSFFRRTYDRIVSIIVSLFSSKASKDYLRRSLLLNAKGKAFIKQIKKQNYDEIIAVDFLALWCVQKVGKDAHFLSLEIIDDDKYRDEVDLKKVKSVISQSVERYDHLFEAAKPPLSIVPNSPFFKQVDIDPNKRVKNDLIFCGSAMNGFGFISCLDFLCDFPEYKLTVIGAVPNYMMDAVHSFYSHLLAEERLIIDSNYYEADELAKKISNYRIGFAFYDFYNFEHIRKFNYYHVPSGKLHQYLNGGVPVVVNRLPGFSMVEEKKAGVLIPHISTLQIKKAIDLIETDYANYAHNAKLISQITDSRTAINFFIDKELKLH